MRKSGTAALQIRIQGKLGYYQQSPAHLIKSQVHLVILIGKNPQMDYFISKPICFFFCIFRTNPQENEKPFLDSACHLPVNRNGGRGYTGYNCAHNITPFQVNGLFRQKRRKGRNSPAAFTLPVALFPKKQRTGKTSTYFPSPFKVQTKQRVELFIRNNNSRRPQRDADPFPRARSLPRNRQCAQSVPSCPGCVRQGW